MQVIANNSMKGPPMYWRMGAAAARVGRRPGSIWYLATTRRVPSRFIDGVRYVDIDAVIRHYEGPSEADIERRLHPLPPPQTDQPGT